MRTKGTAQELEVRRRIAGRMLQQGYSVAEVAAAVGASQGSVKRWRRAHPRRRMEGPKSQAAAGSAAAVVSRSEK